MADAEIPRGATDVLMVLYLHGHMTAKEIEGKLNLKKSSVHGHLIDLKADGLVDGTKGTARAGGRPPFLFFTTEHGIDFLRETLPGRIARAERDRHVLALIEGRER